MEDSQNNRQQDNQPTFNKKQRFDVLLTQDSFLPGIVKERHLVAGAGANNGDLVYSHQGGFTNLGVGSTGQVLMVIAGVPTWQTCPQVGIATARPTSGRFTGDMYFATDTLAFSVWTSSTWKSTTLA